MRIILGIAPKVPPCDVVKHVTGLCLCPETLLETELKDGLIYLAEISKQQSIHIVY